MTPVEIMSKYHITEVNQVPVMAYLTLLQHHHAPTYDHVLRVAELAAQMAVVAQIKGVTPNGMAYAGLLHDVGKILIPQALLNKKEMFTEADYLVMENHSMYGWQMLRGIFELTAQVVVRHHRFSKRPYPAALPPIPTHLLHEEEQIVAAARLLAMADFYDALTTRDNDLNAVQPDRRKVFHQGHPGQDDLIDMFEAAGLLTYL